jgi:hypothetical protein
MGPLRREPFRRQLIKAIATQPGRPYWERLVRMTSCWVARVIAT